MFRIILRAIGLMKAVPAPVKEAPPPIAKEIPGLKPVAEKPRKLELADHPGLDLLALQARYDKNRNNGARRHHKQKPHMRPSR